MYYTMYIGTEHLIFCKVRLHAIATLQIVFSVQSFDFFHKIL